MTADIRNYWLDMRPDNQRSWRAVFRLSGQIHIEYRWLPVHEYHEARQYFEQEHPDVLPPDWLEIVQALPEKGTMQ